MKFSGTYISEWEEGDVFSPVVVTAVDGELTLAIEVSDEGESYEHLLGERVELTQPNGEIFTLKIENAEPVNGQYKALLAAM
jgi:hypothetical protein